MLVIGGLLLGLAVFTQTSGYWLTGVVILVVTALVLLVVWGAGTRLLRWVIAAVWVVWFSDPLEPLFGVVR